MSETKLRAFEARYRITLPADYRAFLAEIGNGGAGPCYGLFPLGMWDGSGARGLEPWTEGDMWGQLAKPFPLVEAWNDTSGMPDEALFESDPKAYDRLVEEHDRRYWDGSRVNGAMPICHEGCGHLVLLVVTGAEGGHLWYDSRVSEAGLGPMTDASGSRLTFASWYRGWLEEALASHSARRR